MFDIIKQNLAILSKLQMKLFKPVWVLKPSFLSWSKQQSSKMDQSVCFLTSCKQFIKALQNSLKALFLSKLMLLSLCQQERFHFFMSFSNEISTLKMLKSHWNNARYLTSYTAMVLAGGAVRELREMANSKKWGMFGSDDS